jgi:hypothetical protein
VFLRAEPTDVEMGDPDKLAAKFPNVVKQLAAFCKE